VSSIHGIACDMVKGIAPSQKQRGETWQVPGISGYGAATLGAGDSETGFTCIKYGASALLDIWEASIEALQYQVVTVVNDRGKTYTGLLVQRVGVPRREPAHPYGEKSYVQVQGVIC